MTAKILLETCVNKGELIIHVCNIYNDEEETVMTAADIKDNDILNWKVSSLSGFYNPEPCFQVPFL